MTKLGRLQQEIVNCERCERLRTHCQEVARVKRRAYLHDDYWGRPVPSFGDPNARLLLVGLAPGAHGANRTGRMFTGDSSGDFLYRALYKTGFASQPESKWRDDGLELRDAYITASAHCAPPDNKPTPDELRTCRDFLVRELSLLKNLKVVVALGRIGFESFLRALDERVGAYEFGHGNEHSLGANRPLLLCSFHPSQQNTSTGRLTEPMFLEIFERARQLITRNSS